MKKILALSLTLLGTLLIFGCSDEHPISTAGHELYDEAYYAQSLISSSSSNDRYYSSSSNRYSSSSYDDWYYSSSSYGPSSSYVPSSSSVVSSSSSDNGYTTSPVTATITLVHYRQLKAMDERNNTDGDPRIYFIVQGKAPNMFRLKDSLTTGKINLGDNVGTWNGSKSVSVKLSTNLSQISICPRLIDEDPFFDDAEYTSKKCYAIDKPGSKIGEIIQMTDNASAYYTIDWEVKLSY